VSKKFGQRLFVLLEMAIASNSSNNFMYKEEQELLCIPFLYKVLAHAIAIFQLQIFLNDITKKS